METNASVLCKTHSPEGSSALSYITGSMRVMQNDMLLRLHEQGFLDILLHDRTSGKNIIWASDIYRDLGKGFGRIDQIIPELILGRQVLLSSIRKDWRKYVNSTILEITCGEAHFWPVGSIWELGRKSR